MLEVMGNLFMPMLYTSLTSAAGFASLALTPIPPVQVFGVFVAVGIMIAWICTITFVPAYVMMIRESSLANFGSASGGQEKKTLLTGVLKFGGWLTYKAAKPILIVIVLVAGIAVYGITRIEINDNPVKWFSMSHPIRRADIELNKHFGGTYMAYLVLESGAEVVVTTEYVGVLRGLLLKKAMELKGELSGVGDEFAEMDKMLLVNASKEITKAEYLSTFLNWKPNGLRFSSSPKCCAICRGFRSI
jgi:predicted RND superfamily exporter protein